MSVEDRNLCLAVLAKLLGHRPKSYLLDREEPYESGWYRYSAPQGTIRLRWSWDSDDLDERMHRVNLPEAFIDNARIGFNAPPETKLMGAELRAFRESADFTQAEAAEELGVSIVTISCWENDHKHPTLRHLRAIAAFYDVAYPDVLELAGYLGPLESFPRTLPALTDQEVSEAVGPAIQSPPDPSSLGALLRIARRAAHRTPEDAAALTGVSEAMVRRWESNEKVPRVKHVRALADLYDADLEELLRAHPKTSVRHDTIQG